MVNILSRSKSDPITFSVGSVLSVDKGVKMRQRGVKVRQRVFKPVKIRQRMVKGV